MKLSEIKKKLFEDIPNVRGIGLTFEFDLDKEVRVVVSPYPQPDKTFPAAFTLKEFKEFING